MSSFTSNKRSRNMQRRVRNTRSEVFQITKNFKKAVTLPSARTWRVRDTEVAARGCILCSIKSKGFLFDRLTNLGSRLITLTHNGLLIIYTKDDKGYVVEVKNAKLMTTETEHYQIKQQTYRRCIIKLKFEYGSACLIMFNEEIPVWRTAIAKAHDDLPQSDPDFIGKHRQTPMLKQSMKNSIQKDIEIAQVEKESSSTSLSGHDSAASITTCVNGECVIPADQASSEVTVEIPEESEPVTVIEATQFNASAVKRLPSVVTSPDDNIQMSKLDLSLSDSWYHWLHRETKLDAEQARKCASESSNSGLLSELSADDMSKTESAKSVRCGYMSVATLRTRLEAKIQGKGNRKEKKDANIRSTALTKTKITNDSLAHKGFRPHKEVSAASNTSSPPPKSQQLGRSQSESNLEHMETRRHNELPGKKSYDDSLVPVLFYENLGTKERPAKGSHNREKKLGEYYSNQWWSQSLRA